MSSLRFIPAIIMSAVVAGCGSSSSDDTSATYTSSYIQLYNGSSNSALTYLTLTDSSDYSVVAGSAGYTDATSLVSYTPASYTMSLSRLNSAGDSVDVLESDIKLSQSYKHLFLLDGDYASPNLLELKFLRDDSLSSSFKLYVVDLLPDNQSYDVYLADSDSSFDDATLVATTSYRNISEPQTLETGNYTIYLTTAGSRDVLFSSQSYSFNYLTEYVLVPRPASGPLEGNIAVDVINNTTTVTHLTDVTAEAQFRVYNSIDQYSSSDIYLNNTAVASALSADNFSDYIRTDAGDFRLSAQSNGTNWLSNRLLTLNQGQSKAVVLYLNSENKPSAIVTEESLLPQIYDFDINVVNTITDYSTLSLYFIAPGETIDTTDYYISSLGRGAQTDISLPAGEYRIFLVHTDTNKNKTLLAESELQALISGSNYLLVAEADTYAATGYKLSLLK